jgi:outer membrane receptor protein involved in Fe transport
MKNNWAWSVSGSRRWAAEGYTPGTSYDGYSFYAAASKVIGKGQLNLTAIAAPTMRGRGLNSLEQSYRIVDDNQYNSAWGYQNGKKRNSRVTETLQPIAIANYTYRPTDRTRWNTAFGFETGKYKSSTIDFYNAYSPRPDYYRNLPAYYSSQNPPLNDIAAAVYEQLATHPEQMQVDWDRLYNANYMNTETMKDVDGIAGNNVTGKRSLYILSNYVDDLRKYSFNTNIEHAQDEHITLTGGIRAVSQQNANYRQATDLLGGDFFVNTYQFLSNQNSGIQSYAQNDLNHPNQLIKKDDIYGYHYILRNNQGEVWGQGAFVYNKFDFFAAANLGYTSFSREGMMRNGLFADHSFGKSDAHGFFTHKTKGGVTYKIDRHNAVYLNADYSTDAPLMSNTYISVQTRDYVINDPTTVKTQTMELGYILRIHNVTARLTGYVSDVKDNTQIKRFFYDELGTQAFVSYIMNKVSTRATGIEFAVNYKIASQWSVNAVASVGQYFYTNSPMVNIYLDNDPTVSTKAHQVYIKNYYMGAGPQSVYSLGVNYSPGRWRINANFNYLDRNYINIYPDRRTPQAVALLTPGSPEWNAVTQQERMPAAFTTDLYISRPVSTHVISKWLHRSTSLFLSLGITNILDKKDIRINGYEQLRYDFSNRRPDKFQNFYDYAFGRNYAANITFRF